MNSCSDAPVGKFTIVSPLPDEYLPQVWEWSNQYSAQMLNDSAPRDFEVFAAMHDDLMKRRGGRTYGCFAGDGVFLGVVWGDFLGNGKFLGHLVFARGLASTKKLEATRECLKRLFADGARKIQWELYADNHPFFRFLQKLNAHIEGRLIQQESRNGELVDTILMASFPEDLQ